MGTRFSTYASYWIKQSIKRALINTAKTIRIPAYMVELLCKWRRATARLTEELGRTPTPEEVARVLGLQKKKLPIIKKAIRIYNATPQTDQAEAGWSLGEIVMDERLKTPEDELVEHDVLKSVHGNARTSWTSAKPPSSGCGSASTTTSPTRSKKSANPSASPANASARSRPKPSPSSPTASKTPAKNSSSSPPSREPNPAAGLTTEPFSGPQSSLLVLSFRAGHDEGDNDSRHEAEGRAQCKGHHR